jgi:hypothetical protein
LVSLCANLAGSVRFVHEARPDCVNRIQTFVTPQPHAESFAP